MYHRYGRSVLNSSEVFVLSQTVLNSLEKIQNNFMRQILKTSICTPIVAMQYLFALLPIKAYVMKKQIVYYQYIANLSPMHIINKAYIHHMQWS